jgi:hypothetical protein
MKPFLRIHHGYIGFTISYLVYFSTSFSHLFRIGVIGEYNVYLAMFGFIVGVILIVHDVWWHLEHERS